MANPKATSKEIKKVTKKQVEEKPKTVKKTIEKKTKATTTKTTKTKTTKKLDTTSNKDIKKTTSKKATNAKPTDKKTEAVKKQTEIKTKTTTAKTTQTKKTQKTDTKSNKVAKKTSLKKSTKTQLTEPQKVEIKINNNSENIKLTKHVVMSQEKKKKHKKPIIQLIIYILITIILLIEISYGAFVFYFEGELSQIERHSVELEFLESTSEIINNENAIPMSDNQGINQDESFVFQVKTTTKNKKTIGYNLCLEKLTVTEGYESLKDNEMKVHLTDYEGNELLKPTLISDLNDYSLYKKYHIHDEQQEKVISKYKLKIWIDKDADASNWNENTKLEYQAKIRVSALETDT